MEMPPQEQKRPSAIVSFIPIAVLIFLLVIAVKVFGTSALEGGSQVVLLIATATAIFIGMVFCRIPWRKFENAIIDNFSNVGTSILMLLLIGAIGGTWMLSGVVPTMIYYGIQILHPKIFLFACCLICAIISLITGSSWTTIATIGVALIGIGQSQGIATPWIAGAIISGAYFGDKISPLSDTTVLASASAGTPLFVHIKYMTITTIPSFVITLIIFFVAGFTFDAAAPKDIASFTNALHDTFNISPWLLLIPVLTMSLIIFKLPPLITLFMAIFAAAIVIPFSQPQVIASIVGAEGDINVLDTFKGVFVSCYGSTSLETSNSMLTELVSTRGMAGMMNTIWLIICAMCFGGAMVGSGMIASITLLIMRLIKRCVSLVASTVFTGLLCNICLGDQYLSIILTCNLFKNFYDKNGYEPRLLSRSAEDSATVTSVLVPWNTCGMTQATVLNVATLAYLPYCFFNLISPIMSIIIAAIGYKIARKGR